MTAPAQRNAFGFVTRESLPGFVAGALASSSFKVNLPATPLVARTRVVAATLALNAVVAFDGAAGRPYTQQMTVSAGGDLFTATTAGYYSVYAYVNAANLVLGVRHTSATGTQTTIQIAEAATQPVCATVYLAVGESLSFIQTGGTSATVSGSTPVALDIKYDTKNTTL